MHVRLVTSIHATVLCGAMLSDHRMTVSDQGQTIADARLDKLIPAQREQAQAILDQKLDATKSGRGRF